QRLLKILFDWNQPLTESMGLKAALSKPFAALVTKKIDRWKYQAATVQEKVRKQLVSAAKNTTFGRDHHFSTIHSYEDFKEQVPVRDYEGLRPYIERVVAGESAVLWPGKPLYLAKTSGTTSGTK